MSGGVVKDCQTLISCASEDWSWGRIDGIDPGVMVGVGVMAAGAVTELGGIVSSVIGGIAGGGGFLSK